MPAMNRTVLNPHDFIYSRSLRSRSGALGRREQSRPTGQWLPVCELFRKMRFAVQAEVALLDAEIAKPESRDVFMDVALRPATSRVVKR